MRNNFDKKTTVTFRRKQRGAWVTKVAHVPEFALRHFVQKLRGNGGKVLSIE